MIEDNEPPLRGRMSCGLNASWLNWHRLTNGCSLRESREEGMRLLKLRHEDTPVPERGEPSLLTPGGSGPSREWVRWYQQKHGCALKEAVMAGRDKLAKQ